MLYFQPAILIERTRHIFRLSRNLESCNMKFNRSIIAILLLACSTSSHAAGSISKYDDNTPDIDAISSIPMFDLVRCLIDLAGHEAPNVYWQPDRPDHVTILWQPNVRSGNRADLAMIPEGTSVRIWNENSQIWSCIKTGNRK